MFENIRADFESHGRDASRPGFWVMVVYRFGQWRYGVGCAWVRRPLSLLYKTLFILVRAVTGIELPCEARVGRNFRIDHQGGIVVSGYAVFGDNCVIRQGVTVGLRTPDSPSAPIIGDNVDIGAGAKLLGPIKIGDNVRIGANAVLLKDAPSGSTAVGVPARIIPANKARLERVV